MHRQWRLAIGTGVAALGLHAAARFWFARDALRDLLDVAVGPRPFVMALLAFELLAVGGLVAALVRATAWVASAKSVRPRLAARLAAVVLVAGVGVLDGAEAWNQHQHRALRDAAASRCAVDVDSGTLQCHDLSVAMLALVPHPDGVPANARRIDFVIHNRHDTASGSSEEVMFDVSPQAPIEEVALERDRCTTSVAVIERRGDAQRVRRTHSCL